MNQIIEKIELLSISINGKISVYEVFIYIKTFDSGLILISTLYRIEKGMNNWLFKSWDICMKNYERMIKN